MKEIIECAGGEVSSVMVPKYRPFQLKEQKIFEQRKLVSRNFFNSEATVSRKISIDSVSDVSEFTSSRSVMKKICS